VAMSTDYSPRQAAVSESYSGEIISLNERWHTWFCIYKRAALECHVSHTYHEEVQLGPLQRDAWDSAGFFQKALRERCGYQLSVLDRRYRGCFIHYGAFSKNRHIDEHNVGLYRRIQILRHTGLFGLGDPFTRAMAEGINRAVFGHVDRSTYVPGWGKPRTDPRTATHSPQKESLTPATPEQADPALRTFGLGILPYLGPSAGGLHSYSLSVLEALRGYEASAPRVRVTLVASDAGMRAARDHVAPNWDRIPLAESSAWGRVVTVLKRLVGEGPHREAWRTLRKRLPEWRDAAAVPTQIPQRADLSHWYRKNCIDLMLYTTVQPPLAPAFEVDIPFVVAIHDVQHRLLPGTFDNLPGLAQIEYITRNCALHATLVLVDSEVGREDLLGLYGADGIRPERVRVLPFCLPPHFIDPDVPGARARARRQYELPDRYLFYPAQFWPHKNHIRIIEALAHLKLQHGLRIPLVLCGSSEDKYTAPTFQAMMGRATTLRVRDQIHYLGVAPAELMTGLYAGATALVMPTFHGPTNLPVLEAWATGCPVLTSRIRGIQEHVAAAGVLVDPHSTEEIEEGIRQLWLDETFAADLVHRGHQRLKHYSRSDFRDRLFAILDEAIQLVESRNP
jgi:glycosyltransferase involved in cell wall biosynthesis